MGQTTKQFGLESVVSSRDFLMVPSEVHDVFYKNHINPINKQLSHAIQLFLYNGFIFSYLLYLFGSFLGIKISIHTVYRYIWVLYWKLTQYHNMNIIKIQYGKATLWFLLMCKFELFTQGLIDSFLKRNWVCRKFKGIGKCENNAVLYSRKIY